MVRGRVIWFAALSLVLSGCSIVSISPEAEPAVSPTPQVTVTAEPSDSPEPTPSSAPTESSSVATVSKTAVPAQEAEQGSRFEFLLAALAIQSEYPSGYDRDYFRHWIDSDRDGCNTRREVLIQESRIDVSISGNCDVSGQWLSLFDGVTTTDPSSLDVDHMVPLKEAWDSGAYGWDSATRTAFANDLGYAHSLVAVTASSNRSKSDRDPAQWLPSNEAFLCSYTFRWMAVKYRWSLSIDRAEALQLGRLVSSCSGGDHGEIPNRASIGAGSPPKPAGPIQKGDGTLDPRFSTCKEAIANGFGNYVKGVDPEYAWYRDGDKDGTVCE
jgi:hypothetical protein